MLKKGAINQLQQTQDRTPQLSLSSVA